MKITVKYLDGICSAQRPNSSDVVIDAKMTTEQMFDALLQFLEHITDKEWAEWERRIDADSTDMVPCRHEFYQGACVHCELPAHVYRKQRTDPVPLAKVTP
jgi:hypothetical protein